MTDNELLLAISGMLDNKLQSELQPLRNDLQTLRNDLQYVRNDLQSIKGEVHQVKLYQENVISPRLDTIESCYIDTYNRYKNYGDKMQAAFDDIEIMKKVIAEHSEKLQELA